jgi:hypothetical protein
LAGGRLSKKNSGRIVFAIQDPNPGQFWIARDEGRFVQQLRKAANSV